MANTSRSTFRTRVAYGVQNRTDLTPRIDEAVNDTYILLYSSNISGKKEPFTMLFQEIAGKIIPKESELPFFAIFTQKVEP